MPARLLLPPWCQLSIVVNNLPVFLGNKIGRIVLIGAIDTKKLPSTELTARPFLLSHLASQSVPSIVPPNPSHTIQPPALICCPTKYLTHCPTCCARPLSHLLSHVAASPTVPRATSPTTPPTALSTILPTALPIAPPTSSSFPPPYTPRIVPPTPPEYPTCCLTYQPTYCSTYCPT